MCVYIRGWRAKYTVETRFSHIIYRARRSNVDRFLAIASNVHPCTTPHPTRMPVTATAARRDVWRLRRRRQLTTTNSLFPSFSRRVFFSSSIKGRNTYTYKYIIPTAFRPVNSLIYYRRKNNSDQITFSSPPIVKYPFKRYAVYLQTSVYIA